MNKALCFNILRAMDNNNVTMVELANRLQCDRSSLYRRICEPKRLKLSELIKIGAAIGVNWRELLEGVE